MTARAPVARELRRLARQAARLPGWAAGAAFATPWHDLVVARRERHRHGARPLGPRVAIYVMFPGGGVCASHLGALEALADAGYGTVVVSNLPLGAGLDAVLPLAARVIERVNYGYDFGAYRSGLLSLADMLPHAERLVLMNDSCWFPASSGPTWLARAEALDVDLAAAASNHGARRPARGTLLSPADWHHDATHKSFHYGSYALMFGPNILRDRGFVRYWRRLRLSADKTRTVSRGEVGLSRWAISRGHSHGATFGIDDLPARLDALTDAALAQVARRLVIADRRALEAALADLLPRIGVDPDWRACAIRVVLTAAALAGPGYALAELARQEGHLQFLKKSPLRLGPAPARATRAIAADLDGPIADAIRAEVAAVAAP